MGNSGASEILGLPPPAGYTNGVGIENVRGQLFDPLAPSYAAECFDRNFVVSKCFALNTISLFSA